MGKLAAENRLPSRITRSWLNVWSLLSMESSLRVEIAPLCYLEVCASHTLRLLPGRFDPNVALRLPNAWVRRALMDATPLAVIALGPAAMRLWAEASVTGSQSGLLSPSA
jgi:hypothetical protein